jgi:ribosomal protein L37AE/L43A
VDLHSQRLSSLNLAKHLGVSPQAVRARLKKLGLKANGKQAKYEKVGSKDFRCSSCGRVKPLRQRHGTICWNCHRKRYISTTKGALRSRYTNKKSVARRKGITFTLSFECFKGLCEQQDGKDGYTGEQLCFDYGKGRSAATASLDRIDNDGGYTEGNVVFCRLATNSKKGKWPVSRLIEQLEFNFSSQVSDASQPEPKEES